MLVGARCTGGISRLRSLNCDLWGLTALCGCHPSRPDRTNRTALANSLRHDQQVDIEDGAH
ncbi:hypothetical protein EI32_2407 [Mycobacterium tuberculosis]|nr:hypothetical protein EI32_2407 [Mycobacterium tuberculosis]